MPTGSLQNRWDIHMGFYFCLLFTFTSNYVNFVVVELSERPSPAPTRPVPNTPNSLFDVFVVEVGDDDVGGAISDEEGGRC
jgi:hypothetical protein